MLGRRRARGRRAGCSAGFRPGWLQAFCRAGGPSPVAKQTLDDRSSSPAASVRTPEVSVVIPTRDRWWLLSMTVRGALGPEGVRHEVIVVDDGSRDETPDRLAAVGDHRLRVVRHEVSRGVAAARNSGIAEA